MFKPGDIVENMHDPGRGGHKQFAIPYGSRAVVQNPAYQEVLGTEYLYVTWDKRDWTTERIRQADGGYYEDNFRKVVVDFFEVDGIE